MVEEDRGQEGQEENANQTEINRAVPRRIITARRRQLAEQQRNVKRRRLVIGISSAAILLVIGAIISGYIVVFVLPPSQLVVRVDDVSYSRGDMVKLMRIKQRQAEFLGTPLQLSDEVFRTLQLLLENEIIKQVAPSYGISVSDEEVDNSIRAVLEPVAGYSPDPNQRELEFRETYRSYLNTLGISEDEHRDLTRTSLLREKFRIYIGDTVPRVADQVHV
ncbi:MAG: SurA N-terminal domain-containing protein, partial [Ardenticatenaceae bacterium]